nr:MAG TPA: nucleoside triphosphate pyrophosphohydrolase [Caudoviricetes sp.]
MTHDNTQLPTPVPAMRATPGGEWDLAAYQTAALATALPTAHSQEYLLPGLISELGELAGVQAKEYRDSTPINYEDRLSEMGDIAWVVAVWLHDLDVTTTDTELGVGNEVIQRNPLTNPIEVVGLMLSLTEPLVSSYARTRTNPASAPAGDVVAKNVLLTLWRLLEFYAPVLAPTMEDPFKAALDSNIAKLTSRQARGKLGGSGDHR